MFQIIGTACIAATLQGGVQSHPKCTRHEDPRRYYTLAECVKDSNALQSGPAIDGYRWILVNCIEEPQ
jgi:hypothetical protein